MARGQGTRPEAPTEEAQGALDASSARQGNSSSSISFRADGETNTNKVAELPDFKDNNNLSGEGSDAYRSGHDNAVALSKQEAEKASPIRPRDDKKWRVGADLHLMSIVAKHEVLCVAGGKTTLDDGWEAAHEEFQQEPAVRISAAKNRSAIESPFDQRVRKQGAKNSDASRAFGCGNTSADDMTEDKMRLEKSTMAVVDAKAGTKADKTEERLKNADKNILGAAAVRMGSRQCGPGAVAISFGDARASDERALVGVLRRRNGGADATASSLMSGSANGRSSPATTGGTPAGVPALGYELRFEMGVLDTNELGKLAGATCEELDLFVNTGFLVEQIDRERAVKMMEEVIKSRFKKVWGGKVLLKFVGNESGSSISGGSDVVGLGALCFSELCVHYGVEGDTFYAMGLKTNWFVNGWRVDDVPTADEFDRLTKALASMLLDGHYSTGPLSDGGGRDSGNGSSSALGSGNDERASGTGAPSGSGPSRQSKGDGKSRKNTKRSDEVNLEGMLEQSTRESKKRAYQGELGEDAGETRKEKRKWEEMQEHRKVRKMALDAERELRADERTAAAATEDATRKEERIAADAIRREERITADAIRREERIAADAIRREERITADAIRREERIAADAISREDTIRQERKDEEDKRRQERKDERAHELAMLQMQLELSKT